jgi:hypothetical protein
VFHVPISFECFFKNALATTLEKAFPKKPDSKESIDSERKAWTSDGALEVDVVIVNESDECHPKRDA